MTIPSKKHPLYKSITFLPFVGVLSAFGLGHFLTRMPAVEPLEITVSPEQLVLDRRYFEFPYPLTTNHGPSGAYVKAEIVLVVELPEYASGTMIKKIDASVIELRTMLATGFKDAVSELGDDAGGSLVRTSIASRLRDVMNMEFGTDDLPSPVVEVLFSMFIQS